MIPNVDPSRKHLKGSILTVVNMKYGYEFDPTTMYQPRRRADEVFVGGAAQISPDGEVTGIYGFEVEKDVVRKYNVYKVNNIFSFKAYREIASKLWPVRPKGLYVIDHINRDSTDDSWSNLRPVNSALNNLNQYREGTKGYIHETQEWLDKVNAARAAKREKLLYLKGPPRNKFIACLTYKGKRHDLGVFETADEATECYLASKEQFIQDTLRDIWTEFLMP